MNETELKLRHFIECVLEEVEIHGKHNDECFTDISNENKNKLINHGLSIMQNSNIDICPSCFTIITDEDYEGHNESRSDYGNEFVTTGFKCHICGNRCEL